MTAQTKAYWKALLITGYIPTQTNYSDLVDSYTDSGAGGGTVTSVNLTAPSVFNVTGGPITGAGTFAITYSGSALPTSSGGLGVTSTPANGAIPIGNGTTYTIANITPGTGISVANSAGGISIGNTQGLTFSTLGQTVYGGVSGATTVLAPNNSTTGMFFSQVGTGSASAAPVWRALIVGDIPNLPGSVISSGIVGTTYGGTGLNAATAANGQTLIGTGSGFALATLIAGTGTTITNGPGTITIANSTSGGTVTSVGIAQTTSGFLSASGTVTTSGNLTVGFGSTPLPTSQGGTGLSLSPSNGNLLIGNGTGFTAAGITAGSGVVITPGVGSITISAPGAGGSTFLDNAFQVQNHSATATNVQFNLSGMTSAQVLTIAPVTAASSTLTIPNFTTSTDTMAVLGTPQTFTGTQSFAGEVLIQPSAQSVSTPNPNLNIISGSNTGIGASTSYAPVVLGNTSTTQTWVGGGTPSVAATVIINAQTLASAGATTFSSPATLYIEGPAIAGTGATFSVPAASLIVAAGASIFGGKVFHVASTTSLAGLNIAPGSIPTSPINGDLWSTSAGLYVQINGGTVGPLGSSGGGGGSTFVDNAFLVENVSDTTKQVAFSLGGATTGTKLTLTGLQTTSQTLFIPNITGSDSLVTQNLAFQTLSGQVTFTGATLVYANNFTIRDATTPSKQINFQTVGASASTLLTINSQQTGNATVSFPNVTTADTLAALATTNAFTGTNTFKDGANFVVSNVADATKKIRFDLSSMFSNVTTTITSNQVTNASLNIPDTNSTDVFAMLGIPQTFATTQTFATSTTGLSTGCLNIPAGTAPTSPVNGAMWATTAGVFYRANGTTQGPFGSGGGGGGTTFADNVFAVQNASDATKQFELSLGGMTTGKVLTLASTQSTSQTLSIPNLTAADTLATLGATSQTFTGTVAVTAELFTVQDEFTTTKKMAFSCSGSSASTTLTIAANQAANATLLVPNIPASDTLVTLSSSNAFSGAVNTFYDGSFAILNSSDHTKQLLLNAGGNTTGVILTIQGTQTATAALTIPNLTTSGGGDTVATLKQPNAFVGANTYGTSTTPVAITQGAATSGSPPSGFAYTGGAHTGLSAGVATPAEVLFNGTQTKQWTGGTTVTGYRFAEFDGPVMAATSATTFTSPVTLYIAGPPTTGTNATVSAPYALKVNSGNVLFGGTLTMTNAGANILVSQAAISTTAATNFTINGGTMSNITAGAEVIDINFNMSHTIGHATGAIATNRSMLIQAPTHTAVAASTITLADTVNITGAPIASTNVTITTANALHVAGGRSQFDGDVSLGVIGARLKITTGTNASAGTAVLSGGAVTVSNTLVTASTMVHVTCQALGTVSVASAFSVTRTGGTSFTITASAPTDTSTVAWFFIEPGP